jgi:GxxExxY protein
MLHLEQETRIIIGLAFEIHTLLGKGFLEIVYKDAIEYELRQREIVFEREKEYIISYKDIILPHKFFADFVVFGQVIVEVKAQVGIVDAHYSQTINYLRVSGCKVGLILNFGEDSVKVKRVVL